MPVVESRSCAELHGCAREHSGHARKSEISITELSGENSRATRHFWARDHVLATAPGSKVSFLTPPLIDSPPEQLVVGEQRRETRRQLTARAHIVRIDPRRVPPAAREPRKHDGRDVDR